MRIGVIVFLAAVLIFIGLVSCRADFFQSVAPIF
jgi:branched-subunit amino acid permease